jgi:FkbM family methyltransferase
MEYLKKLNRWREIQQTQGILEAFSRSFDTARSGLRTQIQRYSYELFADNKITQTYNGKPIVFFTPTFQSYARIVHDEIEKVVIDELVEEVTSEDVFFDIGANIGQFSCIVGAATPAKKVVAFEPYLPNIELLSRNIAVNNVDGKIIECALSNTTGEGKLNVLKSTEPGSQEHTLSNTTYHQNLDSINSKSITLRTGDELIAADECPQPTILKIDVEGAGPQVIRGLSTTLSHKDCRLIIVEPHHNTEEIKALLEELGFVVDSINSTGPEATLIGQK